MPIWIQTFIKKETTILKQCYRFFNQPKSEWNAIHSGLSEKSAQLMESLLYMAAIPAVARLLSWGSVDFGEALVHAILWYGLMVGAVWGISRLVTLIAPSFDSDSDGLKSLTLVFYSFLPFLAGGLLYMVPLLTFLVPLLGLYGIYLLWLGVPVILNTPEKQRIIFTAIIAVVELFSVLLISHLTGGLVLSF